MRLSRRGALGGMMAGWVAARGMAMPSQPGMDFPLHGVLTQGGWLRGLAPPGANSVSLDGKPIPITQHEGAFFIAFDRDAAPSAMLIAHYDDAPDLAHPLTITPRAWAVQNVDAPFHPPGIPDAEFARIRAGEVARIEAARAHDCGAQGWRQSFVWPARAPVSGHFGAQRIYRGTLGTYHSGVDLAAGAGTPYHAPADGTVVLAALQPFTLEGHLLMVDHGMGLNSAFLHASQLLVQEGDRVTRGQPLGLVGMTGRATGPHLHWSLRWREARLDPELFVTGSAAG